MNANLKQLKTDESARQFMKVGGRNTHGLSCSFHRCLSCSLFCVLLLII